MNLSYSRHLSIALFSVAIVAVLVLFGYPTSLGEFVRVISIFSFLSIVFSIAYDKWLWTWALFRGTLNQQPNITGAWRVKIVSSILDKTTNSPVIVKGYAQIDQTSSSTQIRMFFPKSQSTSILSAFEWSGKNFNQAIVYTNDPESSQAHALEKHNGTALYEGRGYNPKFLKGKYWTNRKTQGSIEFFDKRADKSFEVCSFNQAEQSKWN